MSMPRLLAILGAFALVLPACGGDDPPDAQIDPDASVSQDGAVPDSGGSPDVEVIVDGSTPSDATVDGGTPDSGPGDTGVTLSQELVPGSHVQVAEGRIDIMSDSYADVMALLGPGVRNTGVGVRSYTWSLSAGVGLSVWFANTNLDNDDNPPNDVDPTDRVLWVAVQGGFTGKTADNIGLGSSKTAVEAAYGVAPKESPITTPTTGVLAQYYTRGILVAYGNDNLARTITIARNYPQAPDGAIDLAGVRLQFTGGDVRGYRGIGQNGTSKGDVMTRLGPPDAQGSVTINNQSLDTLSYAFIGVEAFFLSGGSSVLFLNIHAPYYGTAGGGEGIGTGRTAYESYLSGLGFGAAQASSSAQFFCYDHPNSQNIGVSYSADVPAVVTSVTFPLLACP